MPRRNKYGARKTVVDGITFDSAKEARRYMDLRILQAAGVISDLNLKERFDFVINGRTVKMRNGQAARYTCDFTYIENGVKIIEEVKGFKVRDYPLRRAIFEHLYGVKLREV